MIYLNSKERRALHALSPQQTNTNEFSADRRRQASVSEKWKEIHELDVIVSLHIFSLDSKLSQSHSHSYNATSNLDLLLLGLSHFYLD